MAARIIGGGKNSRLYKRLVHDEQIATDASLAFLPLELGGIIYLVVTAQPDVDLAVLESAARDELQRFMERGPTAKELERTRTEFRAPSSGVWKGLAVSAANHRYWPRARCMEAAPTPISSGFRILIPPEPRIYRR